MIRDRSLWVISLRTMGSAVRSPGRRTGFKKSSLQHPLFFYTTQPYVPNQIL